MSTDITKKQHYVWRHYLSAWKNAPTDKDVWTGFLSNRQVRKVSLMDIGQSSYFYKLEVLTDDELNFLRKYSLSLSAHVQEVAKLIIAGYSLFGQLKKDVQEGKLTMNEKMEHELRKTEMSAFETIQSHIEKMGISLLNCSNIDDIEQLVKEDELDIQYYIWVQYLRTRSMKEAFVSSLTEKPELQHIGEKCWPFFNFVTALQVVESMVTKKGYRYIYANNKGEMPFITGDQPAINVKGDVKDEKGFAKELELYYPLSPKTALIISDTSGDKYSMIDVDTDFAKEMNEKIKNEALYHIVANDENVLKKLLDC